MPAHITQALHAAPFKLHACDLQGVRHATLTVTRAHVMAFCRMLCSELGVQPAACLGWHY